MIKSPVEPPPATNEFDQSKLTEFAPLSSDVKPTGGFFSRLWKKTKDENDATTLAPISTSAPASTVVNTITDTTIKTSNNTFVPTVKITTAIPLPSPVSSGQNSPSHQSRHTHDGNMTPRASPSADRFAPRFKPDNRSSPIPGRNASTISQRPNRNLSSVLRRLNSILDRKGMQAYKDSDFKLYWMPDDTCNECYECGDKFTTFRRRHHCRICGQIFCSRCCNQEVPGRIFGYKGDLRVCTYCCRVVLSYAQQTDASGDLRSLREDLKSLANTECESSGSYQEFVRWAPARKKTLFPEDDQSRPRSSSLPDTGFSGFPPRNPFDITPQSEYRSIETFYNERKLLTKDSAQLRELWLSMQSVDDGLTMTSHRLRLRTYHNCFTGQDLVDWLVNTDKVTNRDQGCAIGQALVDAKLIENVNGAETFIDEYMLFRAGKASDSLMNESASTLNETLAIDADAEPIWTREIKQVDHNSDDEESNSLPYHQSHRHSLPESVFTSHVLSHLRPGLVRQFSDVGFGIKADLHTDVCDSADTSHKGSQEDLLSAIGQEKGSSTEEPDWWKAVHSDEQHTDSLDKSAYDRLRKSHYEHLSQLVYQQLVREGVSTAWSELILQLACKASEMVQPDIRVENDDMDIRQYVQIKKISGGTRKHSYIISGAVFSKNVAHKKMQQLIKSPKIMLLKNSIVFQRQENKFSSIEPQILQEKEYLRNCVAKVASLSPDLLLVEKTVSKLAKDFLLEAGISLIVNVKPSVMERVKRFTQADIVQSIDGLVSRPRLGLCHTFKIQSFQLSSGERKSFACLDGCATHLGCTIILRCGEEQELAKVKHILNLVIYASYHSKLEISYIMDENGQSPGPGSENDGAKTNRSSEHKEKNNVDLGETKVELRREIDDLNKSDASYRKLIMISGSEEYTIVNRDERSISRERIHSLEMEAMKDDIMESVEESGQEVSNNRSDEAQWCDPLTHFQRTQDDGIFTDRIPGIHIQDCAVQFIEHLDRTLLSVSPMINQEAPYLISEAGIQTRLRQYFPKQIYWSKLFEDVDDIFETKAEDKPKPDMYRNVKIVNPHKFVQKPLVGSIFDAQNQALMADYRARGGQINPLSKAERRERKKKFNPLLSVSSGGLSEIDHAESASSRRTDSLDIHQHQRIAVLFSSYSYQSYNAPNPCINPWVVTMQYYGANDMTLGNFLERLCFRESYTCPNEMCDTPMIDHIRKFVHESGCIAVVLRKLDPTALSSNVNIVMWNWCKKCKKITPPVPISPETWSMSFAKYLELRLHGRAYQRRSVCDPPCTHSLHHEHYQYFGYRHTVAALKFMNITLREVALPPLEIKIDTDCFLSSTVLDDTKQLAVSGYGIYSKVLEYLCSLNQDYLTDQQNILVKTYLSDLESDRSIFRRHIENLQQLVTSRHLLQEDGTSLHSGPGVNDESRVSVSDEMDLPQLLCAISDEIVCIKRIIAQTVTNWNTKIQEFHLLQKKPKPKIGRESTPPESLTSISSATELNESRIRHSSAQISTSRRGSIANSSTREMSVDDQSFYDTTDISESEIIESQTADSDLNPPTFFIEAYGEPGNGAEETSTGVEAAEAAYEDDCAIEEALHTTVVHDDVPEMSEETVLETVDSGRCESEPCDNPENTASNTSNDDTACGSLEPVNGGPSSGGPSSLDNRLSSGPPSLDIAQASCSSEMNTVGRRLVQEGKKSRITSVDIRENKTMKQLLSTFLNVTPDALLSPPFAAEEHHCLPASLTVPVVVYDKEPSSIIAYTLSSPNYESQREQLKQQLINMSTATTADSGNSPQLRRHGINLSQDADITDRGGRKKKAVLSFFRSTSSRDRSPVKASEVGGVHYIADHSLDHDSLEIEEEFRDDTDFAFYSTVDSEKSKGPNPHIELQFSDNNAKFYCRVYYAQQFRQLRKLIFPAGEDFYIRSLARCAPWMARGGKSGSYFCKTLDDRFVLKQMSRLEMQSFIEFAPHYFQYITQTHADQRPTVLAKIVGVYRIIFRNTQTNTATKQDLLVIENVFYGRNVVKRFDLKGSMRNRLVNTQGKREEELVLLDENLLKLIVDHPLYIRPHTKTVLTLAITNDTQFLSSHLIMDYSLLVGIDDNRKELVLGIIDYMRTFTWDKKLEMVVKSSGILGGQGKMPTVISPELYRTRFLEAMDSYFPLVPDRWYGLGQNVDC